MNKNTKIIIGVGVGVTLAYLLFGKKKAKPQVKSTQPAIDVKLPEELEDVAEEDALNEPQTREERIAFILENTDVTNKEQTSGFEGVKFVWNPQLGRYYPKGVIQEGEMPSYADNVFLGFEGLDDLFIGFEGDVDPVSESAISLNELTDKELALATNIVKIKKFSPSEMTDSQALREISDTDPKLQEVVKTRITPRLNDVKVMKKIPTWKQLWSRRKKRISSIREKARTCGRRPLFGKENIASWKSCIKGVSQKKMASKGKQMSNIKTMSKNKSTRKSSFAGVDYNEARQDEFTKQVTNRMAGGMFAGRRFDGRSNKQEETLVREGVV